MKATIFILLFAVASVCQAQTPNSLGGGTGTLASNGLSIDSDTVQLGGNLNMDTDIALNGHEMQILGAGITSNWFPGTSPESVTTANNGSYVAERYQFAAPSNAISGLAGGSNDITAKLGFIEKKAPALN